MSRPIFPQPLPLWANVLVFDVGNTTFTANSSNYYLFVNTNGQNVSIILPSNSIISRAYNVRKINDSSDNLTIATDDANCFIDGNTSLSTNSILSSFTVVMGVDGNFWSTGGGGGGGGGSANVDLTFYVNTDQLSANLSVYPLTSYLTGNYPNTVQLTNNLVPYATNSYLNTNFPNNSQLSSNISNFITGAQLSGNLTVYVNTAQLTNNLANYTNTLNLSTNYPNNSQLSGNLSLYQTTAGLNANIDAHLPNYTGVLNASSLDIGNVVVNSTSFSIGGAIAVDTASIIVGNSSVNVSINSTTFSGTSNNSSYLGGVAAASYQTTAGLNANIDAHLPNYTGIVNASSFKIASNLSVNSSVLFFANSTANVIVVNNYISGNGYGLTSIQTGSLSVFNASVNGIVTNSGGGTANYLRADGTWTAPTFAVQAAGNTNQIQYNVSNSLAADANFFYEVATTKLTLGNSTVNAVHTPTSIIIGNASVNVTMNSTTFSGTALTANNATNLGGTAASGYQTTAGLSGNVATLTANNASYIGGLIASNVVSNAQLSSNLGNYQTTAGLNANIDAHLPNYIGTVNAALFKVAGNLSVNSTVLFFSNSTANVIVVNNYISGNGYGLTSIQTGGLSVFNASVNGIVTNSGGGTTNYLRADGSWTAPSFAVTAAGANTQIQFNNSTALGASANLTFDVAATVLSLGNGSVNVTINSTTFSGTSLTANNATNLGGTAASGYQTTAGLSANVATLTANNSNYLGTVAAASYQQTGAPLTNNVATLSANNSSYLGSVAAASYINISGSYVITGVHTYGNLTVNSVINSTAYLIGAINSTAVGLSLANNLITIGNSSINATINSTTFSGTALTANNATNLGGTAASGYQTTAGLSSNVAGLTANNATNLGGTAASGYQTTAGLSANVATLTANNSNYLGTVAAASYLTNTGAYTISGVYTHTGNLVFGTGARLSANGTVGTANQVLTSNGTIPYWASLASGMISGLVASATTDTTNATNISSGTLANARLPTNILTTNTADQTITGGANITCANLGIKSSGTTTIDCGTCPLQVLTNNGAFTFAAPASDGSCVVLVYNGTAANTITFSGFSVGSSTGDTINYTSGNKFMIHVLRITSNATYSVKALQ